jgi:uncharacterized protein (TIGR02246 family)
MTKDEQAIHDILKRLESAWSAGDSQSFASLFTEDANFIHVFGGQVDGRRGIEGSHRHIFDTIYKGSRAEYTVQSIRFVRPDVAIVFSNGRLQFPEGNATPEVRARPTFVMVKDEGQWQIVAFQNTRIAEMPPTHEAASRL